jgi:hypothetical protein
MLVNLPDAYDKSNFWSLNNVWSEKNLKSVLFLKIFLFSDWVPNSEKRKSNPKNPYLKELLRITESLYSGGGTPASGSTSTYAGSGSTSIFMSGYESTVSSIINLILTVN